MMSPVNQTLYILGLVLLAKVIYGDIESLQQELNLMAQKNKAIDDLFVPLKNGFINRGACGFVFKGKRVKDHLPVAMKFVAKTNRNESDREFEMYTYLNAINNPEVENYGFSPVYYYQEFNDEFMLTVFANFDGGDLIDRMQENYFDRSNRNVAINSLILFRNFILQSKYMHSKGIRHNDIKPDNIMLRKGRSFIIDLNASSKMNDETFGGTQKYFSRNLYTGKTRKGKDDLESFLYAMCFVNKIELGWLFRDPFEGKDADTSFDLMGMLKGRTKKSGELISTAPFASQQLKNVFVAFAKEAFNDANPVADYDALYTTVIDAMETIVGNHQNALFTWLKNENEKAAALLDLQGAIFDITQISNPLRNYATFSYPPYQLEFSPKPITRKKKNGGLLSCCGY